jgi:hypothetical protein
MVKDIVKLASISLRVLKEEVHIKVDLSHGSDL